MNLIVYVAAVWNEIKLFILLWLEGKLKGCHKATSGPPAGIQPIDQLSGATLRGEVSTRDPKMSNSHRHGSKHMSLVTRCHEVIACLVRLARS